MSVPFERIGRALRAAAFGACLLGALPVAQAKPAKPAAPAASKLAASKSPASAAKFVGRRPEAVKTVAVRPVRGAAAAERFTPAGQARLARAAAPAKGAAGRYARAEQRSSTAARLLDRRRVEALAPSARHAARTAVVRMSFAPSAPARLSVGQAIGLKATDDPLEMSSSVALLVDQDSGETLLDKNAQAVLPIASITKLMTALVVVDARLPGEEIVEITEADVDTEKHSRSRLAVGSRLTRTELLHLALMASENRAAHALGRTYPGGTRAFVAAMNARARSLGMSDTFYHDPTGLSSQNQSNARDLVKLMRVAYEQPLIRQFSVAPELTVDTGVRIATFRNTNRLTREASWEIGLQKTGFISEAGNCVVMQARVEGRNLWIVLLDAQGSGARFSDANRLRRWLGEDARRPSPPSDTAARARAAA